MRVLTVPRGSPRRAAISWCVRPWKYASSRAASAPGKGRDGRPHPHVQALGLHPLPGSAPAPPPPASGLPTRPLNGCHATCVAAEHRLRGCGRSAQSTWPPWPSPGDRCPLSPHQQEDVLTYLFRRGRIAYHLEGDAVDQPSVAVVQEPCRLGFGANDPLDELGIGRTQCAIVCQMVRNWQEPKYKETRALRAFRAAAVDMSAEYN